MGNKIIGKIWDGIGGFLRRVADVVAHLTNWQFILLALLSLMAAGILEGIFSSGHGKRTPSVEVTIQKDLPQAADKDASANLPDPPQPAKDTLEDSIRKSVKEPLEDSIKKSVKEPLEDAIRKEVLKQAQKQINSESAEADTAATTAKKPKKSVDVRIGGINPKANSGRSDNGVPLPLIVVLLIIILLAVRIAKRSQISAEKRVLSAEASTEMEALRRQVAEAQLQTLQAQVEPHFLFNTLAAVEHLTETDPPRATVMLQHLIAFLRGSLPSMRE
ncbi:MAG: histidine kinase, partial [Proteobacteria bacterium]|nr:histidine kinase [Pseudomonadota bacterium]